MLQDSLNSSLSTLEAQLAANGVSGQFQVVAAGN